MQGDELKSLSDLYKGSLQILKLCNNKIDTLEQVKLLVDIVGLVKLDLTGNKVCDVDNYRQSVFEAFPKLEALDGTDKNDQPVESEDDSDEDDLYGDEEGELENDELLGQLDEDTRKRLMEGKMTAEELEALGVGEDDFFPEEFGEDELDEDAEEGDESKDGQ